MNMASDNSVMFATLCSNPEPMKAKRHQKIMTSFPTSLVARALHQTARHTSQLHNAARQNRAQNGALTLASAADVTKASAFMMTAPELQTIAANATEPIRLPSQLVIHTPRS